MLIEERHDMRRSILLSVVAVALAGCGQAVHAGVPPAAPTPNVVAIRVATSPTLGSYLTTAAGRTLYYFAPERDSHSATPHIVCTGSCVTIWPPLLAQSGLLSASQTLPSTLRTVGRPDGGRQVTYADWPLYTFSGDHQAGHTNGQGVLGQWFVAGTGLTEDLATPTPTPPPTPAPTSPPAPRPAPTSCIPGSNGGDHDGDNNGLPSDGDGCQ
jgi:predicted lipoprotein with Yx(FWY)xxD motif